MSVITMSNKEVVRLRNLIDYMDGRLSVDETAALMGVGRRQVYRLILYRCETKSVVGRILK